MNRYEVLMEKGRELRTQAQALGWTVDDSYHVVIEERAGEAKGELRSPSFPSEVGANESWEGTINAFNNSNYAGVFRFRVNSAVSDSFTLPAGGTVRLTLSGTGPADFTIYLERSV